MPTPIRIDPAALEMEPLELDPAAFQSPLPEQNYHLIFQDEDIGLAVGVWDTTTMQETFGPYPGDEFITVLEGGFAMVDAAGETLAAGRAGDSVTFRNAIPTSWKQDGYLRKIYLTLTPPGARTPVIDSAMGGVTVLPGAGFDDGGPDRTLFRNDAGTMTVSFRRHAEAVFPAARTETHELCRVLSGGMSLTDDGGRVHVLGPGDHAFLPAGTLVARATRADTTGYHVHVAP